MKKSRSSNPVLIGLIQELTKKTYEEKASIWRDVASRLTRPASNRAQVNISGLSRCTKENEVVVVPGKVLGSGILDHPITVGAFDFSAQAAEKIKAAGGECMPIRELMTRFPKGSNIKLVE